MRVFVVSSGSSGNAILVEASDGSRVLIDAGLGPRVLTARLAELGVQLLPRSVDAILLTHHHGDHFAHAESLARALRAPVYLHAGIAARRLRDRWLTREYAPGAPFQAAGFEVRAVYVPHDAPQVALSVASSDGARFGLATDVGHISAPLTPFLRECDAALVEANYCPRMLESGPYPPRLKARVSGGFGHLSNEQTAEIAARLVGSRMRALYLGHLSRTNNTPDRALAVVSARARGIGVRVVPHGVSQVIGVTRGTATGVRGAVGIGV